MLLKNSASWKYHLIKVEIISRLNIIKNMSIYTNTQIYKYTNHLNAATLAHSSVSQNTCFNELPLKEFK